MLDADHLRRRSLAHEVVEEAHALNGVLITAFKSDEELEAQKACKDVDGLLDRQGRL